MLSLGEYKARGFLVKLARMDYYYFHTINIRKEKEV